MKYSSLFCLALLLISCSDDEKPTTCSVRFPTAQLPWLKEMINEYRGKDFIDATVVQAEYNSQTVFIIIPCCPTCNTMPPPVYTCKGVAIEDLSFDSVDIKDRKEIWKTPVDNAGCW